MVSPLPRRHLLVLALICSLVSLAAGQAKDLPQKLAQKKETATNGLIKEAAQPYQIDRSGAVSTEMSGILSAEKRLREKIQTKLEFSVVSVRQMSDDEAFKRTPHSIYADTVVRLRVRNEEDRCVYYFTYAGSIVPLGYRIMLGDEGLVWLGGREGKRAASPGIQLFPSALEPKWTCLKGGDSIEWDNFDETRSANERHSFSIFVKENEKAEPVEIFSTFYTVPAKLK